MADIYNLGSVCFTDANTSPTIARELYSSCVFRHVELLINDRKTTSLCGGRAGCKHQTEHQMLRFDPLKMCIQCCREKSSDLFTANWSRNMCIMCLNHKERSLKGNYFFVSFFKLLKYFTYFSCSDNFLESSLRQ